MENYYYSAPNIMIASSALLSVISMDVCAAQPIPIVAAQPAARQFGAGNEHLDNTHDMHRVQLAVELQKNTDNRMDGSEPNVDTSQVSPEASSESNTIVVTGSHIRGTTAAGANVDIYDATQLERSGYATVQDFINTLPQNFQGGGGSEAFSPGGLAASNVLGGSSVNLRGLGADSTLVLINGRRPPASGLQSDFTDISSIPQTAVERIEILPDGASALYGSDAVGGVVNFILRKDFDGADTRLRYGFSPDGNVNEYRVAQAFGWRWDTGHVLASYEYYRRDRLRARDRSFTSTYDRRAIGGADLRPTTSNPGNIVDPLTFLPAYAIPTNQNGRELTVADLIPGKINRRDVLSETTILPEQNRHTGFLFAEQNLTDSFTVFAEARYSERKITSVAGPLTSYLFVPSTNPFFVDPFGSGYTVVSYSFEPEFGPARSSGRVKNGSFTGGAQVFLKEWRWETYLSYGFERSLFRSFTYDPILLNQALADPNPDTAFNPFGHGLVNNPDLISRLRQQTLDKPKSRLVNIRTVADGPLVNVNGNDISLAIGGEYIWDRHKYIASTGDNTDVDRNLKRRLSAVFSELHIPLIAENSDLPLAYSLELSAAVRYDHYSDFGGTTNPKFGMTWLPTPFMALKATYGTSYRAPNLVERLSGDNLASISLQPDVKSSNNLTNVLLLTGTAPDIDSEKAETWTIGFILDRSVLGGVNIEINYFSTIYKNRISRISDPSTALALDNVYSELVIRNPSQEQLSSICSGPTFEGDPDQCVPGLVGAIVDMRTQNMARNKVRGIDFDVNWNKTLGKGLVSVGVSGTYIIDYMFQITDLAPKQEQVNTVNNPIDFRSRGYLSYSGSGLGATLIMNYWDSYRNNLTSGRNIIKSHFTTDFNLNIQFNNLLQVDSSGQYGLNLSVINIFENDPPIADTGFAAYDSGNFGPLGQTISAEMRIKW